uniref:RNA-directed RNA polymerase n=1 Tax=Beihai levi-like virus 12 TaxID=1922397 RepID=A0A1L3KIG2_9VIRU|nr:hypothetical protein [Beihai levi-like virus 12]
MLMCTEMILRSLKNPSRLSQKRILGACSSAIGRFPKEIDVLEHVGQLSDLSDLYRSEQFDTLSYTLKTQPGNELLNIYFKVCEPLSNEGIHTMGKQTLTLLSYMTRLTLSSGHNEDDVFEQFCNTQNRLKNHVYGYHSDLFQMVREKLTLWFSDFDINSYKFSAAHSIGATVEARRNSSLSDKWDGFILDENILKYIHRRIDPSHPLYTWYTSFPFSCDKLAPEFKCVPKSYKTLRGITYEPTSYMHFEQDLMIGLKSYIRTHPFLSTVLRFEDQSLNKTRAKIGSLCQNLDTIDLSSASDSVTKSIVTYLFSDTKLGPLLELFSADKVSYKGQQYPVETYGGMGNALTFPIESVIFLAIAEVSRELMQYNNDTQYNVSSVYGDDIVVDTFVSESVMTNLSYFGFLPNFEKSFTGDSHFRESCGGEYLFGHDVTPLRIPRKMIPIQGKRKFLYSSPAAYASYISHINDLYDHGYVWTSRNLLRRSTSCKKFSLSDHMTITKNQYPRFSCDPDDIAIVSYDNFDNSHLGNYDYEIVYNKDDAVEKSSHIGVLVSKSISITRHTLPRYSRKSNNAFRRLYCGLYESSSKSHYQREIENRTTDIAAYKYLKKGKVRKSLTKHSSLIKLQYK